MRDAPRDAGLKARGGCFLSTNQDRQLSTYSPPPPSALAPPASLNSEQAAGEAACAKPPPLLLSLFLLRFAPFAAHSRSLSGAAGSSFLETCSRLLRQQPGLGACSPFFFSAPSYFHYCHPCSGPAPLLQSFLSQPTLAYPSTPSPLLLSRCPLPRLPRTPTFIYVSLEKGGRCHARSLLLIISLIKINLRPP